MSSTTRTMARNIPPSSSASVAAEAGVRPSMGSVGDAYDNAMAESFFATLECELLDRRRFKTQAEARIAVFEFIEGFYNPRRRHSSLGYLSPTTFERHYEATALEPGAHQHAVVLAPVKERPASVIASCIASVPAVLDSRSTRPTWPRAGRDEKMLSAEPKDCPKEEDTMQHSADTAPWLSSTWDSENVGAGRQLWLAIN